MFLRASTTNPMWFSLTNSNDIMELDWIFFVYAMNFCLRGNFCLRLSLNDQVLSTWWISSMGDQNHAIWKSLVMVLLIYYVGVFCSYSNALWSNSCFYVYFALIGCILIYCLRLLNLSNPKNIFSNKSSVGIFFVYTKMNTIHLILK